ncbi:unnamed protein product [Lactuca saligna]|uniref:Uncharacterized protein n=1 Tax=Lactuca saligna TaxID=75948 RepID=A0AA36A1Z3_LACSI|nr:unnamed protein product [Lactuca saligna]
MLHVRCKCHKEEKMVVFRRSDVKIKGKLWYGLFYEISTPISTKLAHKMATTVSTIHVEVDVSKLKLENAININEGGSLTVKPKITVLTKDKRKGLQPSNKEKNRMKEI